LTNFAIDNTITVYPNPTNALVTIESSAAIKQVDVQDALGRTIETHVTGNVLTLQLPLAHFAQGAYVLSIETQNGLVKKQIAIVR
ncbi:MAG TPA: T9SS type A sorting domain-containing protein, partial [Chitinophagales bacterium]|nr:T9SS type A sorting domain-containing protein [Chitinophagales bacterium]